MLYMFLVFGSNKLLEEVVLMTILTAVAAATSAHDFTIRNNFSVLQSEALPKGTDNVKRVNEPLSLMALLRVAYG